MQQGQLQCQSLLAAAFASPTFLMCSMTTPRPQPPSLSRQHTVPGLKASCTTCARFMQSSKADSSACSCSALEQAATLITAEQPCRVTVLCSPINTCQFQPDSIVSFSFQPPSRRAVLQAFLSTFESSALVVCTPEASILSAKQGIRYSSLTPGGCLY